jgi:hypothetical protein
MSRKFVARVAATMGDLSGPALPHARRLSAATRRRIACGAIAMLLPSGASAACTGVWDLSGRWILSQTNMAEGDVVVVDFLPGFGNVLRGSAAFRIAGSNRVDGRITGNSFSFTVPWSRTDMVGVYTGAIDEKGRIGGTTFDRNHPKNTAGWRGNRAAKCIMAAAAPPPVVRHRLSRRWAG